MCLRPHSFWKASLVFVCTELSWSAQWVQRASPSALCIFLLIERIFLCFPTMSHGGVAVSTLQCPPPARTCTGSGAGLCNGSLSCVCLDPLKHHLWAFLASVQPIPSQARGCAFLNMFLFCVTQQPPCCAYCRENWVKFHGLMLCRRANKVSVTSRKV